jgi:hypothetical protein
MLLCDVLPAILPGDGQKFPCTHLLCLLSVVGGHALAGLCSLLLHRSSPWVNVPQPVAWKLQPQPQPQPHPQPRCGEAPGQVGVRQLSFLNDVCFAGEIDARHSVYCVGRRSFDPIEMCRPLLDHSTPPGCLPCVVLALFVWVPSRCGAFEVPATLEAGLVSAVLGSSSAKCLVSLGPNGT